MKKFFWLILGIVVCILGVIPAFAENFYITNYDVKINVDKNKIAHVTEIIDTYFTNSSHGIYRTIPLKGNTVTNIHVSEENKISVEGDDKKIKIGNPDRYITGNHQYIISYDYNFTDNKNEFYYNIIGTEWDTEIKRVSFSVTMLITASSIPMR